MLPITGSGELEQVPHRCHVGTSLHSCVVHIIMDVILAS